MESSQELESQEHINATQLNDGEAREEDTFSILIATDNHLGYLEKDPVRGDDSFAAFEEILALAAESEVDMILLGGDLFHENKPSRKTMYITTKLLRKYCMGDKPVSLEFLSEPTNNFPEGITTVNYMDPNLNVSIPVFSIHGNHDDPSGDGNLCALDQLAMAGLVNYFGRSQEIDNVNISPILMQKGATRLALYGIGNIRDERLHQTFLRRKVTLIQPNEDSDEEPWYNLLVLHQNRVMHGPKNYIPEAFLDEFIDLVIWGHEHECLIDPVYNPQQGFHVSQPGSSVATSLSEGESKEKHVAILKISKGKFNIQKIRLKTVRPFVMSDVVLSDHQLDPTDQQKVNSFISRKVRDLIRQANEEWVAKNGRSNRKRRMYSEGGLSDEEEAVQSKDNQQESEPPKPLIRLRVEYSGGYEIFNPQRFGQEFVDLVANPRDIVHFFRRKTAPVKNTVTIKAEIDGVDTREELNTMRVENLVQKYLSAQNLSILPEIQLADAVRIYVEKDEKDAVKDFVGKSLDRMQKAMRTKQNIELEEALLKEASEYTAINREKDQQAKAYAREYPNGGLLDHKRSTQLDDSNMEAVSMEDDEEDDGPRTTVTELAPKATNSRKNAVASVPKSRASATSRASGSSSIARSSRSTKKPTIIEDSLDEDEGEGDRDSGGDGDYQDSRAAAAGTTMIGSNVHVIEDTDEEEQGHHNEVQEDEEDDFLVPKRGTKAKGKTRAKSPAKTEPKPRRRASPVKKTTTAVGAGASSNGAAAGGRSTGGASSSRAGTAARSTSQAPSQNPSQHSRLVSSIGSRKKKLL
ncbi:Double-strand break repair protein mre11a [Haplosporangium sp. Z 767]|nr:Double-strand break repair protein mre11a [Haplosporangium sp. Z 767]